MNDSLTFAHQLNEYLHQNSRSPLWLAQQLGVEVTAVQSWLDGECVPEDPETIAQIEKLLHSICQKIGAGQNRGATTPIDSRSGGVYFGKAGDVRVKGDIVGRDQITYNQQFGESSLTTIKRKLGSALGWSIAPPEIHQPKVRLFWWSVRHVYRAHPWFWRVMLTAVILVLFLWLCLWPYLWRPKLITRLNTQGTALIQAGEYTQAIQILGRANRLYPHDARTHYNLGNAYDLLPHNQSQAIVEFNNTINLDDRFWPAYNNLARLLILTGSPEAALDSLRAGIKNEMPAREAAIFQKNMGWAILGQVGRQECPFSTDAPVPTLQQATVTNALSYLEKAQTQLQAIRESGENVSIYLAEVYLLQGCAYEALWQREAAHRAWSDGLAHATAILYSEQCIAPGPLPFDCLKAEAWKTLITDRLGDQ